MSPGLVLETRDVRPGIRRSGPGRSAVAQCAVRQRLCSVCAVARARDKATPRGDTGMLRGLLSSKVSRSVVLYCTERVPRHRPHTGYGSPTETPASSGPRGSGVSLRYVPVRRWGPRAAVKAV